MANLVSNFISDFGCLPVIGLGLRRTWNSDRGGILDVGDIDSNVYRLLSNISDCWDSCSRLVINDSRVALKCWVNFSPALGVTSLRPITVCCFTSNGIIGCTPLKGNALGNRPRRGLTWYSDNDSPRWCLGQIIHLCISLAWIARYFPGWRLFTRPDGNRAVLNCNGRRAVFEGNLRWCCTRVGYYPASWDMILWIKWNRCALNGIATDIRRANYLAICINIIDGLATVIQGKDCVWTRINIVISWWIRAVKVIHKLLTKFNVISSGFGQLINCLAILTQNKIVVS